MKKYLVLCIAAVMVLSFAVSAYAWEISFDNTIGGAIYEESDNSTGTEIKSSWSSFVYKGNVVGSKYDNKYVQGEIFYGMSVAPTSTETWNINGTEYQTNDMSFWGIDTGVLLGWAFPIEIPEKMDIALTPLVGYQYKFTRFTRSNFVVLRKITITATVDEDYNIHSLDLGARVNFKINDKFNVFVKPIFGIVLYNSANNSVAGTIKGDGGFLFNLDAGLNYAITKNFVVEGAFRMELQRLNGATSGSILWPDNSLDNYGGTITVRYKF